MPFDRQSTKAMSEHAEQESDSDRWLAGAAVFIGLLLLAILTYAILTTAGIIDPQRPAPFISIDQPNQGTALVPGYPVNVAGRVASTSEGELVVRAISSSGNVLVQEQLKIAPPDADTGDESPWSAELTILAPPGTAGQIVALSISSQDGTTIASDAVDVVFGSPPVAGMGVDLRDHLWVLAELDSQGLLAGTYIDLHFDDFRVEGAGGCNLYTTSYESRGSNLNFDLVTSTAKECEIPPGVLQQERAYFEALESVTAFSITAQRLTMFDGSGRLNLVYDAVLLGQIVAPSDSQLPTDALISAGLYDFSHADVEPQLIAEQMLTGASEFPIAFMVKYDPALIRRDGIYALHARIEDAEGKLLFSNPVAVQVFFEDDHPMIDIMLEENQE